MYATKTMIETRANHPSMAFSSPFLSTWASRLNIARNTR